MDRGTYLKTRCFLEIAFVQKVCTQVYLCLLNHLHEMKQLNRSYCFLVYLAINIINGQLALIMKCVINSCQKGQGDAVINQLYSINKMEHFSFKSGCAKR